MGSIPTQCDEEFEVTASGRSKDKAKESAQETADKLCKRLKKKCDTAHELSEGSFVDPPDIIDGKPMFVYTSTYVCAGKLET